MNSYVKDWLERLMIIGLVILILVWVLLRLLAAGIIGAVILLPLFVSELIIWCLTLGMYKKWWLSKDVFDFILNKIVPPSDDDCYY